MKKTLCFSSNPDFSGNSKALYEYIKKKDKDKMNYIWVVRNEKMKKKLEQENVKVYLFDEKDLKNKLKGVDVFFSTHAELLEHKNKNQIYVELWHGVGIKKMGYVIDEENFTEYDIEFLKNIREKCDFIIAPSNLWKIIYCATFNIKPSKIIESNLPRIKYLYNTSKKNIEKLYGEDVSIFKSIIFYLPTFRSGAGKVDGSINNSNILNLDRYDENDLLQFLEKNKILLMVKKHPAETTEMKKIQHKNILLLNDSDLQDNMIDLNSLLGVSDMLITDYSSVYIEYMLLNRPVIFLNSDVKTYMANRGIVFDNSDFWFRGEKASDINSLLKKIKKNLKKYNKSEIDELFLDLMYSNKELDGAKTIYDRIFENK